MVREKASLGYLVDAFLAKNYDSEIIYLNDLNFRGCQSRFYCRTHESCVLKDDLTPIYNKVEKADKILLAMPVFYGSIPG
ncbi:flavodoxin family protein [endosymbiont 'TC1' of Trimyema compressum]|uniref:flavodoxin family protein n=1 Tax=endosymbiont 'TC1' of Trimyema compressum TaxID=243899 RepID=UPI001392263E|nr:NAD(P)H-dependent oxidoreductase [endosymbiont 'TC1' of Trimyema compressum]